MKFVKPKTTPSAEQWLIEFTQFVRRNHDVEPVTDAFMKGLPYFREESFINEIKLIGAVMQHNPLLAVPDLGVLSKTIYAAAGSSINRVYDNYIAKGKSKREIRKAFEEYARNILEGHEKLYH